MFTFYYKPHDLNFKRAQYCCKLSVEKMPKKKKKNLKSYY